MPIAITPPAGVNYGGSTLPRAALLPWTLPKEGAKAVPLSVSWVADGGPNLSINVNLRSTQVVTISQIVGLYVDNIRNQAAVTFYFPDTQFVLEVPPLSFGWYPVITTQIQFTMYAPKAVDQDQTIVQVLNYWVDPAAVSNFAFSDNPAGTISTGAVLTLGSQNTFTQVLIPLGTEGIITAFQLDAIDLSVTMRITGSPLVGTSLAGLSLTDATGIGSNIFWETALGGSGYHDHLTLASLSGLNIEMTNGLAINCNAANAFMYGYITSSIYWRQPS